MKQEKGERMNHKLSIEVLDDFSFEYILASYSDNTGCKRMVVEVKPSENTVFYAVTFFSSSLLDEGDDIVYHGECPITAIEEYNKL